MTTAICSECEGEILAAENVMVGEILECPDCGTELEVTGVSPLMQTSGRLSSRPRFWFNPPGGSPGVSYSDLGALQFVEKNEGFMSAAFAGAEYCPLN